MINGLLMNLCHTVLSALAAGYMRLTRFLQLRGGGLAGGLLRALRLDLRRHAQRDPLERAGGRAVLAAQRERVGVQPGPPGQARVHRGQRGARLSAGLAFCWALCLL